MPLITKAGCTEVEPVNFMSLDAWDCEEPAALDIPNTKTAEALVEHFENIDAIRITFPQFSDGRGYSLARSLRQLGYTGKLRASGHLVRDQFSAALDIGFDEIEIDEELFVRQSADLWTYRSRPSYRAKLAARTVSNSDYPVPDGIFSETVTEVEHYTDGLFRFQLTRPESFRFKSGEFAMIGLNNAENPIYRAYSIASPFWDETLEFYSVKVPNGPLTEKLQHIKRGDRVLLKPKTTGTLVHDVLVPGKRLWLFSTGTGIAPYASLIRDPETYSRYESVYLIHTCRCREELEYGFQTVEKTKTDPLVGELTRIKLVHYATTTREKSQNNGRITSLLATGKLFDELGIDEFSIENDRAMICGSIGMLNELKAYFEAQGFSVGTHREPGEFAIERAFVD